MLFFQKRLLFSFTLFLFTHNCFAQTKTGKSDDKDIFLFNNSLYGLSTGKLNASTGMIEFHSINFESTFELEYFGNNEIDKRKIYSRLRTSGRLEKCFINFEINLADTELWIGDRTLGKLIIKDCYILAINSYRISTTKTDDSDSLIISDTLWIESSEIGVLELQKIDFMAPLYIGECVINAGGFIIDFTCRKWFYAIIHLSNSPLESNFNIVDGLVKKCYLDFQYNQSFTLNNIKAEDSLQIKISRRFSITSSHEYKPVYELMNITRTYLKIIFLPKITKPSKTRIMLIH